jgi:hypothetical protein
MGFCVFNNVAAAAAHALEVRGLTRVAVVDWDVHHGNGTQEIFWDDPRVLLVSLHQDNNYPLDSGEVGLNRLGGGGLVVGKVVFGMVWRPRSEWCTGHAGAAGGGGAAWVGGEGLGVGHQQPHSQQVQTVPCLPASTSTTTTPWTQVRWV